MCLSFSLNSLISVLSCFYSLLLKTTGWITQKIGWFSGNQLNQFCSLPSLISFSVIHHWISLYLQSVCSWGDQDHFFGGCVFVICDWWIPSGFWELDVALGIRVNQYKSICVFISFPELYNICFKLFLFTVVKNNRLKHKNNRLIFWKST